MTERRTLGLVAGILGTLTLAALALRGGRPPDGRIELVWASSANPHRAAQIELFNELHPGLRVVQDSSNNRLEKNIVQLCSGVGPDLYDAISGAALQVYVETEVAWDLTPLAEANGLGAATASWPALAHEIVFEGRQYGYPANVSVQVALCNLDLFASAGEALPAQQLSWEEFVSLLSRVAAASEKRGGRIHGLAAMDYSGRAPAAIVWKLAFNSMRGEYFSPDGSRVTIDTADMRRAFELHRDAIFKHKVHPASSAMGAMTGAGAWGGGALGQFAEGRFAAVVSGKFALASLREFVGHQKKQQARWDAAPENLRTGPRPAVLRIGAIPLPRFSDRPAGVLATAQTVVINPDGKRRKEALEFLRFLASETYARTVMPYGLPGNPARVTYDFPVTHPELGEHAVTRCVVDSLAQGYQTRKSPFLMDFDVERVVSEQIARLEADPSIDIGRLLREAQRDLEEALEANVRRNPALAARRAALARENSP